MRVQKVFLSRIYHLIQRQKQVPCNHDDTNKSDVRFLDLSFNPNLIPTVYPTPHPRPSSSLGSLTSIPFVEQGPMAYGACADGKQVWKQVPYNHDDKRLRDGSLGKPRWGWVWCGGVPVPLGVVMKCVGGHVLGGSFHFYL